MPLLHRKTFNKKELPVDLKEDEEVFHCAVTNEVFRDYEEYFNRIILCNSLVWSCSLTGKCNLTFQEALDSEKEATKRLRDFPKALEKPLLFLVALVQKSRIDDLNDDILSFVKHRYFVGEQVTFKKQKCMCKIISVKSKSKTTNDTNGHSDIIEIDDEDEDMPLANLKKTTMLKPDEVEYEVYFKNSLAVVAGSDLRRPISALTRDKSKVFLKLNCYQEFDVKGVYIVKDNVMKKYNLDDMKWSDVHAGPNPVFTKPEKYKKALQSEKKGNKKYANETEPEAIRRKIKEMRQTQEMEREEKKKEREEIKKKKLEEAEKIKQIIKEERDRKKKERDEEIRLKREKIKEDKKLKAAIERERNRPRDDLYCDDLKPLPLPKEVQTQISHEYFGSVLSLVEFFHVFEDLFDAKDEFPNGVTVELVESALLDTRHESHFCDFLFFFLSNIFRTHIEEEGEKFYELQSEDKDLSKVTEDIAEENVAARGSIAATWAENYHGAPLHKLELNSYTVSEILRLYMITSAARPPGVNRMWRYQQRGGYSYADEIPMRLCFERPDIIEKLSTTSVFNLDQGDKLSIMHCLANHLLTFVTAREFMEEMSEKLQAAQNAFREDKLSEKKREKEAIIDRLKWKTQQANLAKEMRTKEVMKKIKHIQSGSQLIELSDDNTSEPDQNSGEKPRLYTPEETEEYLQSLDEEEKEAVDAWKMLATKHETSIAKLQKNIRIKSIGQDRYYRRYWVVNCIPGIFVEEFVDHLLNHEFLQIKVPQTNGPNCNNSHSNKVMTNGDSQKEIQIKLSDCEGLQRRQGIDNRWYLYETKEEIATLLNSLNMRGHRESHLRENILRYQAHIDAVFKKFPINPLHTKATITEGNSVLKASAFELAFRDQLLEFEERIWFGTLGILNAENRELWKARLTNGEPCDATLAKTLIDSVNKNDADKDDKRLISPPYVDGIFKSDATEEEKDNGTSFQMSPKELAICLLEIERGIDHKYLKLPLGCSTPIKRKTRSKVEDTNEEKEKQRARSQILLCRWEKSLIQCTSISQVSLHLATLDASIIWARSLLNASCRICKRKGDDEKMLLCDMCDRGHHMYCLRPALKTVPPGSWFCPDCKPRARPSPRKMPRKISFSQNASSDEEENDTSDTDSTAQNSNNESDEDNTTSNNSSEEEVSDKESTPPRKSIAYKFTNKVKNKSKNGRTGRTQERTTTKNRDSRGTKRSSSAANNNSTTRRTSGFWKELNVCQDILCTLTKHDDAWPFLEPVKKKEVPDYYDIIDNPMDFSTIREKHMNAVYSKASEFVDDVMLVFHNCLVYNLPKSNIVKAANTLRQEFEHLLRCNNLSQYIGKKKKY